MVAISSLVLGCGQGAARTGLPAVVTTERPSFVNKVWVVQESPTVHPGQLYVFLSEGSLVVASPHGTPRLGSWSLERGSLTIVEDGVSHPVDVVTLTDSELLLRLHDPGEGVEVRLVSAGGDAGGPVPAEPPFLVAGGIEARGNEPFWTVRIAGTVATVLTPETLSGEEFPHGVWTQSVDRWRFDAWRERAGARENIALEIAPGPCTDGMSDWEYPYAASFERGELRGNGCAGERRAVEAPASLDGTSWRLIDLGGRPALEGVDATLVFLDGGRVGGNGSCNRFFSTVTIEGDTIRFSEIGSTKMACADEIGAQELSYFRALEAAERFVREDTELRIYSLAAEQPLRFAAKEP